MLRSEHQFTLTDWLSGDAASSTKSIFSLQTSVTISTSRRIFPYSSSNTIYLCLSLPTRRIICSQYIYQTGQRISGSSHRSLPISSVGWFVEGPLRKMFVKYRFFAHYSIESGDLDVDCRSSGGWSNGRWNNGR